MLSNLGQAIFDYVLTAEHMYEEQQIEWMQEQERAYQQRLWEEENEQF